MVSITLAVVGGLQLVVVQELSIRTTQIRQQFILAFLWMIKHITNELKRLAMPLQKQTNIASSIFL